MRKRFAVLVVAAAFLGGAPVVGSPVASAEQVQQAACKRATIGGQSKCIAAGQFCARRYQSDYKRNGYSCSKRDANGRYHLKKL